MTNNTPTTTPADFQVGDTTIAVLSFHVYTSDGYYSRYMNRGTVLEVRRVNTRKILVRNPIQGESYWVERVYLEAPVPVDPNAPKPRKLGEKPAGSGHISIDDPRIAWLWADLSTYAENKHFCSQYDELADAIGIPGRKREFTVTTTIAGGLSAKVTVKARSQKLADAAVAKALADGAS
jgi:hypothetical protein